ncbi:GTP-binding protein [Actinomadura sp. J1-007]|uniref:GTP-binding protein n=1 Tax=Actinomadura sp. J1-007 TaxID=2661913 RepID=UPI00132264FD|nr:GTP-binding protein [Actinomadura sp. J1-007]MWK33614.1 GTP-binding protein [Actinomadura sp. J1-007]
MATLNIGILAHVDAGKTSLTERLLFDTGVIGRLGSVDAGDTQTDRGELERRRGITIRSAVASFTLDGLRVNLIDTPGHADFVAEVERALAVLDGAVLVLSAVEGVQPQTRVLLRTLRDLRIPTLVFVNKIDRAGARRDGTLEAVRRRLTPRIVPLNDVTGIGTASAARSARPGRRSRRRWTRPRCWPTTTTASSPTWSRTASRRPRRSGARSPPRPLTGPPTRCSSGRRSPGRASPTSWRGSPRSCRPRPPGTRRKPRAEPSRAARSSPSNAARPERRSPTCACSRASCASARR